MVFLLEGFIGVSIAIFLIITLAEISKFRLRAKIGFSWIALSGIIFLFLGVTKLSTNLKYFFGEISLISIILEMIGWIFILIGTLFISYEVLVERK